MRSELPRLSQNSLCVLLLALLVLGAADGRRGGSRPNALPLVTQAIQAKRSQRFVARQDILLFDAQAGTRIVADVVRDGCRVRLCYRRPASAAGRIVVDDGRSFWQWEPSRHLVLASRSHEQPETVERRMLGLLAQNYRCLPLRRDSVNGQPCDLIVIRPRHRLGCHRRLWVDRVHHAILRTEEYDAQGRCRYLSFYETFRFVPSLSQSLFQLTGMGMVRKVPRLVRDQAGARSVFADAGVRGRLPAWLPPGYALVGCALAGRGGAAGAAVLRYGDGLQTFCVIEGNDVARSGLSVPGPPREPAVHYGQRVWEGSSRGLHVTVIGDTVLPVSLGQEVLRALTQDAEAALRERLLRDYGPRVLATAARLRRQGWDYGQIASLEFYLRAHPRSAHSVEILCGRGESWSQIVASQRVAPAPLERRARFWIGSALHDDKIMADY